MNYSTENKIWRVGGPLFVYLGVSFFVQLLVYLLIFYVQFNEWNINAAFNGLLYAEQLNMREQQYGLLIQGISLVITIPVFAILMKKDYEYPVSRREKETIFNWKKYNKENRLSGEIVRIIAPVGMFATLGVSRLILMLPLDNILGSYSDVKTTYEAGGILAQIIVLCILSPVMEELLFRGLVYKRLKIYYDPTIAAYIAAIIFGVVHFNLLQGIYAFAMGVLFAYVYEKFGNIYVPILLHVIANITSVITMINPLSSWIDRHIWLKLPIALLETAVFVMAMSVLYKYKVKKESEEQEKSKFDFSV